MADYSNKNLIEYEADARKEKLSSVIFLLFICTLLVFFIYLKTSVFMLVSVKGDSMCNTLSSGDLLFADRTSAVSRGDIVVILRSDVNEEALIKRVIGVEGDTLWSTGGYVYRSYTDKYGNTVTEKLNEDYVYKQGSTGFFGKVTVPKGCIFVLGDNREISSDSRSFGFVELNCVLGVVPKWSVDIKNSSFIIWYKNAVSG